MARPRIGRGARNPSHGKPTRRDARPRKAIHPAYYMLATYPNKMHDLVRVRGGRLLGFSKRTHADQSAKRRNRSQSAKPERLRIRYSIVSREQASRLKTFALA